MTETDRESFEEVCSSLVEISRRLIHLLPDPSIGPEERVERLARVISTSTMESANHLTARTKLNRIRRRLQELVPNPELSPLQKIDYLISVLDKLVPSEEMTTFEKLEQLGDLRGADNGRMGIPLALLSRVRDLYPDQTPLFAKMNRAIDELSARRQQQGALT